MHFSLRSLHPRAIQSRAWRRLLGCTALVSLWPCLLSAANVAVPTTDDAFRQHIAACTSCHGEHGEGAEGVDAAPRLAGKPAAYLALQLRYFQDGQRKHATMAYMVRYLDAAYMREMAEYFAHQDVPYGRIAAPTMTDDARRRGEQLVHRGDTTRGVPSCASCHGLKLGGVQPLIPSLNGLSADYIQAQLDAWRAQRRGAREPDCMAVVANRMQATDVQSVSAWLASRDVVPKAEPPEARTPEPLPGWCRLDTGVLDAGQLDTGAH